MSSKTDTSRADTSSTGSRWTGSQSTGSSATDAGRTPASERLAQLGRRLVTTDDGAPRSLGGSVDGAPRWAAGLAAGLQAALLSFAVVVAPTLAAYVATSADPSNAEVGWLRSIGVGAGIWLLGHGVPLAAGGVQVTLIPLGITLLAGYACHACARRSGYAAWSGYAAALGGYLSVVLAVALMVAPGAAGVVRAIAGAAVIAALGLGAGLLARPEAPLLRDLSRPLWIRVPGAARAGIAAGVLAAALLVIGAVVVVLCWIVVGHGSVTEVGESLDLDVIGGTVLAVGQVAFVPDLVGWALAYLAGPGFVIGAGSHFAAGAIVAGPLPALPLLGVLPQPGGSTAALEWLPAVLVLVGAVAGWWLHARLPRGAWWHALLAVAVAAVVAAVLAGTIVALSSGSAGPGRMTEVGGSGLLVGLAVAGGTAIGLAAVVLPLSPEVRAAVRGCWRRVRAGRHGVRGR
ncbi:cell division protein PerM [Pengzhenrongella sicca]|uniref:Uncharacterized protein n=1 Tax=Pengzhenrongella sicca TaxID=2819238 RepID=A0A8A4ZGA3_9MICO|nr:DUF6350 family protein [Pengzhenrongella sicca]QTE29973.1 hypothetical protein J4E96_02805 [Pengzhenrongella sicca]